MIFSIYTSINISLILKINGNKELRENYLLVYIRNFYWWDIIIFICLTVFIYFLTCLLINKVIQKLYNWNLKYISVNNTSIKYLNHKIFLIILGIWLLFFLTFYPGSTMNDTIYILQNPWKLSNQHPILYNLYLYGFYQIGCCLGNPNLGLALLSLFQMLCMDYVLTKAISIFYTKRASSRLCLFLTLYFALSPIFSIYAISAIKDTPFSICLFALVMYLYELAESKGALFNSKNYIVRIILCTFGIISFRNNGFIIIIGLCIILSLIYKHYRTKIVLLFVGILIGQKLLCMTLIPAENEPLFQESVGIPIQQIGAAVVKGKPLTPNQEEYLYTLLPKEQWQCYSPACSDNLKWNAHFDREFLNQTKLQFLRIWFELFLQNPKIYTEAYILNTYGIWGIETRNKEQYYFTLIDDNTLGLIQKSPLPEMLRYLIAHYYCNRFTCRYLSMGTAYWILFATTLWILYKKSYLHFTITIPLWMLFISLLLATPIAFAFRYGFVMSMILPFIIFSVIILPIQNNKVYSL